jgi:hypothetical protein
MKSNEQRNKSKSLLPSFSKNGSRRVLPQKVSDLSIKPLKIVKILIGDYLGFI